MRPIAYLYDIILWSTQFNTTFKNFVSKIQNIRFQHLLIVPFFILFIGWIWAKRSYSFPFSLSIMTTGFSEIIYQIIVILAFQSLYGYVYYRVGLIMASFMGGLVLGSFTGIRILSSKKNNLLRFYRITQLAVCLYPLILPVLFILFRDTMGNRPSQTLFASLFAMLPIIAGFIGGLQYPLATQLIRINRNKSPVSQTGSFLYALDVFGATLGAILTATIFIPLLGVTQVAMFCCILNAVVLVLLFRK